MGRVVDDMSTFALWWPFIKIVLFFLLTLYCSKVVWGLLKERKEREEFRTWCAERAAIALKEKR